MELVEKTDRAVIHRSKGIVRGKTLAFPVLTGTESPDLAKNVEMLWKLADQIDNNYAEREAQGMRPAELKAWLNEQRTKFATVLNPIKELFEREQNLTQYNRDSLLTVKSRDPTDAVGFMQDARIVDSVEKLDPKQREKLFHELELGKQPHVRDALARDLRVGTSVGEMGRAVYAAQQGKIHRSELADMRQRDEGNETVATTVRALESWLMHS